MLIRHNLIVARRWRSSRTALRTFCGSSETPRRRFVASTTSNSSAVLGGSTMFGWQPTSKKLPKISAFFEAGGAIRGADMSLSLTRGIAVQQRLPAGCAAFLAQQCCCCAASPLCDCCAQLLRHAPLLCAAGQPKLCVISARADRRPTPVPGPCVRAAANIS